MFTKFKNTFLLLTGAFVFIMTTETVQAEASRLILDTTKGQIEIELKPDLAPNHVARISELAAEGFYDGIISGEKLEAEFTDYPYVEGTVGMARSMSPDSGDSQFFICFDGCGHLTGQYTVWGQVSRGMDVVQKINAGEPPAEPDSIVTASLAE